MQEVIVSSEEKKSSVVLPFKAVIFDMDGTLIASTKADYLAWAKLFEDENKSLTYEEYVPLLGIKSAEVIKTYLNLHGEELQHALRKKLLYFDEVIAEIGLYPIPHADVFLKSLKEYPVKIALATSSRKAKMEMALNGMDLFKYFDVIVTGEEVMNGKPAPDIFIKTAEKLDLQASECIVIEDAANGVIAAKNAFMKCVAITTTHEPNMLNDADLIITTFENQNLVDWGKKLYF
jgi:HAD superfamily hydrolase (TIGR01509 family)